MITTVAELIAALQEFNPTDRVSIVTGDEDNTEELGAFELHGRGGDYCEIFIPAPEFAARVEEDVRGCSCGMADYGAPGHEGHEDEIVGYIDPEDPECLIPVANWTSPNAVFHGQPVPENYTPVHRKDLDDPRWQVTI